MAEIKNKQNSKKKTPLNTEKATALQQNPSSLPLNPSKTDQKSFASMLNPDLREKAKSAKLPYSIPKEKKERERLMNITGVYNLDKANKDELQKCIKLEKKTPDDYYDINQPYNIIRKRIDEAFGPKTDFSISNFENNFDKMNKEEQGMLTYKMQRELNKTGYTDSNGEKLKEDGIFGNKTKSAYNKYKNDNNKTEYYTVKGTINDKENQKYYDMALKDSNGNPIYLASSNRDLSGVLSSTLYKNTTTNNNKILSTIKEKEDSQLSFDDQKKIDALVYTCNNTDNIIEKEACIRAIVKIRQQEKYKNIYSNSDKNGLYKDGYEYEYPNSGVDANVNIMSGGVAWLEGGDNAWNDLLQEIGINIFLKDKLSNVFNLLLDLVKLSDPDYYEKAKNLKENDIMVTVDGIYPDSEETIHNKYFYRDKRGHLYKILENN